MKLIFIACSPDAILYKGICGIHLPLGNLQLFELFLQPAQPVRVNLLMKIVKFLCKPMCASLALNIKHVFYYRTLCVSFLQNTSKLEMYHHNFTTL